jgi:hypothetical protein
VINGQSLRSIVKMWECIGLNPVKADRWSVTVLKGILTGARVAGLRVHQSKVIGKAAWEPILDENTWHAVRDTLQHPSRRTSSASNARKHLLPGFLICGYCDDFLRSHGRGREQYSTYLCPGCGKIARRISRVDELITELVIARLEQLDLQPEPGDLALPAATELAAVESRIERLRQRYQDGDVDDEDYFPMLKALRERTRALRAELARAVKRDAISQMAGTRARLLWENADLSQRRAVLSQLITAVRVNPSTARNRFDPASFEVIWCP